MLNFSLVSLLLISTGLVSVLIFNTNPFEANAFTIGAFFISLLAFCFSLFSIALLFIRKAFKKRFTTSLLLRRTFLLSLLLVGLICFSSLKVLNTMSAITYLIALVLLEFFFSSKKVERDTK